MSVGSVKYRYNPLKAGTSEIGLRSQHNREDWTFRSLSGGSSFFQPRISLFGLRTWSIWPFSSTVHYLDSTPVVYSRGESAVAAAYILITVVGFIGLLYLAQQDCIEQCSYDALGFGTCVCSA